MTGVRTRAIQITPGYLYIYRADFVWPCMRWKRWRWVEAVEERHIVDGGKRTRVSDRDARREGAGDRSEGS
jgi:hypothetical protein